MACFSLVLTCKLYAGKLAKCLYIIFHLLCFTEIVIIFIKHLPIFRKLWQMFDKDLEIYMANLYFTLFKVGLHLEANI